MSIGVPLLVEILKRLGEGARAFVLLCQPHAPIKERLSLSEKNTAIKNIFGTVDRSAMSVFNMWNLKFILQLSKRISLFLENES